jgi:hypothetical protein
MLVDRPYSLCRIHWSKPGVRRVSLVNLANEWRERGRLVRYIETSRGSLSKVWTETKFTVCDSLQLSCLLRYPASMANRA